MFKYLSSPSNNARHDDLPSQEAELKQCFPVRHTISSVRPSQLQRLLLDNYCQSMRPEYVDRCRVVLNMGCVHVVPLRLPDGFTTNVPDHPCRRRYIDYFWPACPQRSKMYPGAALKTAFFGNRFPTEGTLEEKASVLVL
jgi:hypothetical protein